MYTTFKPIRQVKTRFASFPLLSRQSPRSRASADFGSLFFTFPYRSRSMNSKPSSFSVFLSGAAFAASASFARFLDRSFSTSATFFLTGLAGLSGAAVPVSAEGLSVLTVSRVCTAGRRVCAAGCLLRGASSFSSYGSVSVQAAGLAAGLLSGAFAVIPDFFVVCFPDFLFFRPSS